jgi:hypothetical protein
MDKLMDIKHFIEHLINSADMDMFNSNELIVIFKVRDNVDLLITSLEAMDEMLYKHKILKQEPMPTEE